MVDAGPWLWDGVAVSRLIPPHRRHLARCRKPDTREERGACRNVAWQMSFVVGLRLLYLIEQRFSRVPQYLRRPHLSGMIAFQQTEAVQ